MITALDKALAAASAAEATYQADQDNIAQIQTAIDTATSPLAAAQQKAAADAQAFNDSLDAVSQAALAAKVAIPTAPTGTTSGVSGTGTTGSTSGTTGA